MTGIATRSSTSHPQFLTLNGRRLFALRIEPVGPCRGSVLYLPPFAEEMNRCRSHVAAQARALAGVGLRTLLLDPFGTGESDGSIVDAQWRLWLDDAVAAAQWLAALDTQPVTLWGVRTGAMLAAEVAASGQIKSPRLLLWQPVVEGKIFLKQYFRLRIASQMVNDAQREQTDQIRARLAGGEILEVAGYPLTGVLADGLAAQRLSGQSLPPATNVAWLEVVARAEQPIAPAAQRVVAALRAAGMHVRTTTVVCPMIWQLHQRVSAPELLRATLGLLQQPDVAGLGPADPPSVAAAQSTARLEDAVP